MLEKLDEYLVNIYMNQDQDKNKSCLTLKLATFINYLKIKNI